MFYHIQNGPYTKIYLAPRINIFMHMANVKMYATEEDYEKGISSTQTVIGSRTDFSVGMDTLFLFEIYTHAYAIEFTYALQGINHLIILDAQKDSEDALEDRTREAVLTTISGGGIVVPYSDNLKYNIEIVNEQGETIEITSSSTGNTFMYRIPTVYVPTSGVLAGVPCMRLWYNQSNDNAINNSVGTLQEDTAHTVKLSTLRPYTVFISGLQMPNISSGINNLHMEPEAYEKTYYVKIT